MRSDDRETISLRGAHGLRLAADAYGPEGAPVVLLMHGGGQTRHSWGGTARALAARGYRAISVDARGHGESDRDPERRYQLAHFSEDLSAIAASFDRPPAVVGASLGGSTALLAHGEMELPLGAMVLVDIGPRIERSGVERIFAFMKQRPEGYATLDEVADAVASYQPHRERPKDVSGLAKNLRLGEDGRYRWHWDPAFLEEMSVPRAETSVRLEHASRRARCPVMLVRGRLSDLLTEQQARDFLALCTHAEYVDVADAAHMVAGDVNDRFTDAVVEFLGRTYAPTGRDAPFPRDR